MARIPNNRTAPKTGGFTLTEMVVVIGIILVVAAVGIPMFTPFFRGRALRAAADIVKQNCIRARSLAVQNRINFIVVIRANPAGAQEHSVEIIYDSTDLSPEEQAQLDEHLPGVIRLPDGIVFGFPDPSNPSHNPLAYTSEVEYRYIFTPRGRLRPDQDMSPPTPDLADDVEAFLVVDVRDNTAQSILMYETTGRVTSEERAWEW